MHVAGAHCRTECWHASVLTAHENTRVRFDLAHSPVHEPSCCQAGFILLQPLSTADAPLYMLAQAAFGCGCPGADMVCGMQRASSCRSRRRPSRSCPSTCPSCVAWARAWGSSSLTGICRAQPRQAPRAEWAVLGCPLRARSPEQSPALRHGCCMAGAFCDFRDSDIQEFWLAAEHFCSQPNCF